MSRLRQRYGCCMGGIYHRSRDIPTFLRFRRSGLEHSRPKPVSESAKTGLVEGVGQSRSVSRPKPVSESARIGLASRLGAQSAKAG